MQNNAKVMKMLQPEVSNVMEDLIGETCHDMTMSAS